MRRIAIGALATLLLQGWADISVGGSPSVGMGGAGLAVMRNPAAQSFLNPAAIAYVSGFRIGLGNIETQTQGASFSRLLDDLEIRRGSAADIATAAGLLRRYARQDTQLLVTGDLALIASGVGISVGGIVDARLLPNTPLRNWAISDGNPANIPANARGDIIAVGIVSLPDFTAGVRLPYAEGDLAVGARVRFLKLYYTHYFADRAQLQAGGSATRAPELQGRDFLEKSATAVDLGFLWRPQGDRTYTLALVVENFVEPEIRFQATNRDGQVFNFKPLKRTYHAGVAVELETGSLFALDIIDIGNSVGRSELRFGYEQRLGRTFAVSTGYASRTGWTIGLGVGGFRIAYADRMPVVVSRTLNF
ncbi:MAG: conjugal transfer protein TraF [Fimbriimonadales bacterium]|nr:conjugal transfer protein TraF [Fimbriimonadales bacterium]